MLDPFLSFNIALDGFPADSPCGTRKIRTRPEAWQFGKGNRKFLSERKGGNSLDLLHHIGNAVHRPDPDKEMDMIGLNGQFENGPSFFKALLLNDLLAACFDVSDENRF